MLHQPRRKLVGKVSLQNALLDQNRVRGRIAFIIDIQRTATAFGIVPLSTTVHLSLATRWLQHARERRGLLAIEVGFQSVTDRLVKQDARPTRTQHNFHLAGRCFARIKLNDRLPCCFLREVLRRGVGRGSSPAQRDRRRRRCRALNPMPPTSRCRTRSCATAAANLQQSCRPNR